MKPLSIGDIEAQIKKGKKKPIQSTSSRANCDKARRPLVEVSKIWIEKTPENGTGKFRHTRRKEKIDTCRAIACKESFQSNEKCFQEEIQQCYQKSKTLRLKQLRKKLSEA